MLRFGRPAMLASGLALVAALTFATGVTAASAKTTAKAAPSASAGVTFAPPAGYQIVEGANVNAPAGAQTHASVACPGTKKPLSGGVFVGATSTAANINDSYPKGKNWVVDVNNASASDTNVNVFAVCANRPTSTFSVTKTTFTAEAGEQTSGTKACPTGVIIGGGAFTNAGSLSVNLNSSLPVATGWRVDINNASASAASFTVWAICRKVKPGGYSVQTGTAVSNPAGAQTEATATCPGNSLPVGGGVFSQSGSTLVSINSTSPSGHNWVTYENNGSAAATFATPYAVCAGK